MQRKPSKITFSKSFEEMNKPDAKLRAMLTGVPHLGNTTRLIKALYAEELKKPM